MTQEPSIAVLCLGHSGNPAGIARLSRYFAATPSHIYLHIDAKADITPYRAALANCRNVSLVEARIEVFWSGFSIVRAITETLRLAYHAHDYHRFCLISEDSVPLVTPATFTDLMGDSCEYIHARCFEEVVPRYTNFYYLDSAATNPRSMQHERIATPALTEAITRLEALRARGKLKIERLFHGAGWWAITDRAACEILLHYDHSTHLRDSFEFSFIPDEQYFHTILGNAARRFTFRPFMYSDFSREPRPYIFRTAQELLELRKHPLLFARKAALDSIEVDRYVDGLA